MGEPLISDTQIDRITGRATKFLGALSRNGQLRRILAKQGGYTAEEHAQGWNLLLSVLGYRNPAPGAPPDASPAVDAITELDSYDGPTFARARAALERSHPEQAHYLFEGLSAKTGVESVGAVRTFVDRVAALRTGSDPARAASRDADRAAANLLAKRRIVDEQSEAHLRALIARATELGPVTDEEPVPDPSVREGAARELNAWLNDWRETARALITRRDYQIMLGLAQRRTANGVEEEEEPPTSASSN